MAASQLCALVNVPVCLHPSESATVPSHRLADISRATEVPIRTYRFRCLPAAHVARTLDTMYEEKRRRRKLGISLRRSSKLKRLKILCLGVVDLFRHIDSNPGSKVVVTIEWFLAQSGRDIGLLRF